MARRKRQVQIVVDVKSQKAIRAIRKLAAEDTRAMTRMQRNARRLSRSWRGMGQAVGRMRSVMGGFSAVMGTAAAAVRVFAGFMEAAAAENSGINRMRHSLQALGSVDVPRTMQAIEAFAAQQQRLTRFGDDQTRAIVTNLATVLNGTETTSKDLTRLAGLVQDVVEQTGYGVEEVARTVGRAQMGQVEGLNELLSGQGEYLGLMLEVNGAAVAGAAAIDALTNAFGGQASSLDSYEQGLSNLSNTWGDFRESMGRALLDAMEEAGGFASAQEFLDGLVDWMTIHGPGLIEGVGETVAAFRPLLDVLTDIAGVLSDMPEPEASPLFALPALVSSLGTAAGERLAELTTTAADRERLEELRAARERNEANRARIQAGERREDVFAGEGGGDLQGALDAMQEDASRRLAATMRREEIEALRSQREAEQRQRDAAAAAERMREEARRSAEEAGTGAAGGMESLAESIAGTMEERQAAADQVEEFLFSLRDRLQTGMHAVIEGVNSDLDDVSGLSWFDAGQTLGESLVDGMETATTALQGFASTIPRIMGDSAQDGADRIAAVFQFLGQAAQLASSVGLATKAASSWLGPLSSFLSMASAAAAFASAMGKSSGMGGGRASTGARGAVATEAADVLVGQRPEAERGGQARIINFQIGTVLNNDSSRKEIASMVRMSQELGELGGV